MVYQLLSVFLCLYSASFPYSFSLPSEQLMYVVDLTANLEVQGLSPGVTQSNIYMVFLRKFPIKTTVNSKLNSILKILICKRFHDHACRTPA